MTHDDVNARDTNVPADWLEIDALLDGQPVDKATLRQVLADPDAREHLLDALELRQLTWDMGPTHYVEPPHRTRMSSRRQWVAAAIVALVASGGGYLAGVRAFSDPRHTPSLQAVVDFSGPVRAPQPTQVIQLEPIVAIDRTEGNR